MGFFFIVFSKIDATYYPEMIPFGILLMICGVIAISCSVFTFKRKFWLLTLLGSVVILVASTPFVYNFFESFGELEYYGKFDFFWILTIMPGIACITFTLLFRKQTNK